MTAGERNRPRRADGAAGACPAKAGRAWFAALEPSAAFSISNLITAARLGIAMGFFVTAIRTGNPLFNYIGLGVHWLGDVADGFLARWLEQETILGAEIDLIADRVDVLFFFVIFLGFRPDLYLPVFLYVLDFAFVDFYLSYQFTRHGIISPNYFGEVDDVVYGLNYSPAGKFANSVLVPLLLIFLPHVPLLATVMAVLLLGVKGYSIIRLRSAVVPETRSR